jgi:hypothetical protein
MNAEAIAMGADRSLGPSCDLRAPRWPSESPECTARRRERGSCDLALLAWEQDSQYLEDRPPRPPRAACCTGPTWFCDNDCPDI